VGKLNKKLGGLGKGLGALIPEEFEESSQINDDSREPKKININMIKANENQPRRFFDQEKIALLAESIKEHGIVQPIVLKKDNESYVIVAGERRWRAAKLLGLKEVPALVMDLTDKEVLEISLIENLQREDLNPIEEALAYKRLIDEFDLTQEELGIKVGKSRTAVTNSMRLLMLDSRVQEYLIEGVISEGHGRTLLAIHDGDIQYELAQKIIDEGLSVRQIEFLIKKISEERKSNNNQKDKDNENAALKPYLNDIKYKLENYFGTKVSLTNNKNNKGKIEIEYYSQDDLNRILEMFNV
jgi:ParB family transcriptional regulator, chromosome partitioning protein